MLLEKTRASFAFSTIIHLIHPLIHLTINPPFINPFHSSIHFIRQSINSPIHSPIHAFIHPSTHSFVRLSYILFLFTLQSTFQNRYFTSSQKFADTLNQYFEDMKAIYEPNISSQWYSKLSSIDLLRTL